MGLQQGLKGVVDQLENSLPSSRFSIGGTPDQAAAAGQHYRDQGLRKSSGSLAIFAAIRRVSGQLSELKLSSR